MELCLSRLAVFFCCTDKLFFLCNGHGSEDMQIGVRIRWICKYKGKMKPDQCDFQVGLYLTAVLEPRHYICSHPVFVII